MLKIDFEWQINEKWSINKRNKKIQHNLAQNLLHLDHFSL